MFFFVNKKLLRFFFVASLLASVVEIVQAMTADQAWALAQENRLYEHSQWRRLLYFDEGASTSRVAEQRFFISELGAVDPAAEMHAMLEQLLAKPSSTTQPVACQFPARADWLAEQLSTRWSKPNCPKLEAWLKSKPVASVTLVFPDAFISSPPSMFGHTFLRLDPAGERSSSKLLSWAVNYAARTEDSQGPIFALRGLSGGYDGRYSIDYYYRKVREYGYLQQRDLWEYPLSLEAADIRRLLLHLWELRDVAMPYYFFTQNCSLQLLKLLQIARPTITQWQRFKWWAAPVDTIRVLKQAGLTGQPYRRASPSRRLQQMLATLSDDELQLLQQRLAGAPWQTGSLPVERHSLLLDAALMKLSLIAEETQANELEEALLKERKSLPKPAANDPIVEVMTQTPDSAHGTARVALGFGRVQQQNYLSMQIRPVLHDLLDPAAGYQEGAQIDFLNVELRVLNQNGRSKLRLGNSRLLELSSLNPWQPLQKPWSWRLGARLQPVIVTSSSAPEVHPGFKLHGGAGLSIPLKNTEMWGFAYGLVAADWQLHAKFDKGFRFAPELALGWLQNRQSSRWRLEGFYSDSLAGQYDRRWGLRWGFDYSLARDLSLRIDGEQQWIDDQPVHRWQFGIQRYL